MFSRRSGSSALLYISLLIIFCIIEYVKNKKLKNLHFGKLHKEWTEAGVKASRATTHRRLKEFGYCCRQRHLTWAKEKKNWTVSQWSKVLFSDESIFFVLVLWSILICWDIELVGFCLMWAKIITIKITKDLNYFSLCALNLFNTQVSQFELNYWNKGTFPQHSNLLR